MQCRIYATSVAACYNRERAKSQRCWVDGRCLLARAANALICLANDLFSFFFTSPPIPFLPFPIFVSYILLLVLPFLLFLSCSASRRCYTNDVSTSVVHAAALPLSLRSFCLSFSVCHPFNLLASLPFNSLFVCRAERQRCPTVRLSFSEK